MIHICLDSSDFMCIRELSSSLRLITFPKYTVALLCTVRLLVTGHGSTHNMLATVSSICPTFKSWLHWCSNLLHLSHIMSSYLLHYVDISYQSILQILICPLTLIPRLPMLMLTSGLFKTAVRIEQIHPLSVSLEMEFPSSPGKESLSMERACPGLWMSHTLMGYVWHPWGAYWSGTCMSEESQRFLMEQMQQDRKSVV